jgi:hypothetical protein
MSMAAMDVFARFLFRSLGEEGASFAGFILIDGWEVLVGTFLSKARAFLGNGACVRHR